MQYNEGSGTAGRGRLARRHWTEAALRTLVQAGIAEVKIDRLAHDLAVSRGSFYWHFDSREALLQALLGAWQDANTKPFLAVLDADADQPVLQFRHFCSLWLGGGSFDPALDSAVRDWARSAPEVDVRMRAADEARTQILNSIFLAMGYDVVEAEVRARITYYHQVGYYALRIDEAREQRMALVPTYFRVLAGMPLPRDAPID